MKTTNSATALNMNLYIQGQAKCEAHNELGRSFGYMNEYCVEAFDIYSRSFALGYKARLDALTFQSLPRER